LGKRWAGYLRVPDGATAEPGVQLQRRALLASGRLELAPLRTPLGRVRIYQQGPNGISASPRPPVFAGSVELQVVSGPGAWDQRRTRVAHRLCIATAGRYMPIR